MAIKDDSAVAVKTAPLSMPDASRIFGFTARMYAIVMNVVIPAITSVFTSVWFSLRWNNLSRFIIFPLLILKIAGCFVVSQIIPKKQGETPGINRLGISFC